jgi:alpha-L-fucosidase
VAGTSTRALAVLALVAAGATLAPGQVEKGSRNKPERLEWFRDLGFGLFIHWSVDGSLRGRDQPYPRRRGRGLRAPVLRAAARGFSPRRFHPADWAALARLAGMKYVVFTTKHHSGFCMWTRDDADFDVMRTPFARDVTAEIVKAFRDEGCRWASTSRRTTSTTRTARASRWPARPTWGHAPRTRRSSELDRAQLRELMTGCWKIDVVFLDGPAERACATWCGDAQPDAVVTRGAIETPEQNLPGVPLDRPWEACITMGTEWNYKPTHETYKSGTELVETLIETRAKGGNLLLNVGPKPDGELPIEQEERLREIALWNFVYGESLAAVRPWVVTNEGDVWFTRKKGEDTVYAIVTRTPWVMGERKTFTLRSVKATEATRVSVLGHGGELLEYRPDVDPRPRWKQTAAGLELSIMMAQRLYTNRQWPDPIAVKLTHVVPALTPPVVATGEGRRGAGGRSATLRAELKDLGQAAGVEAGFQYRRRKGSRSCTPRPRLEGQRSSLLDAGAYSIDLAGLGPISSTSSGAMVRHPLLTVSARNGSSGYSRRSGRNDAAVAADARLGMRPPSGSSSGRARSGPREARHPPGSAGPTDTPAHHRRHPRPEGRRHHYGPAAGIPELRAAVAEDTTRRRGVRATPEMVVVTPGGKPVMFFVILALVDEGDEVLYPNPGFPIYESMIRYIGGNPVPVRLLEDKGFALDVDQLVSRVNPRTRLIILNYPHNPTGARSRRAGCARSPSVAAKHGVPVLSDEIYSRISTTAPTSRSPLCPGWSRWRSSSTASRRRTR